MLVWQVGAGPLAVNLFGVPPWMDRRLAVVARRRYYGSGATCPEHHSYSCSCHSRNESRPVTIRLVLPPCIVLVC